MTCRLSRNGVASTRDRPLSRNDQMQLFGSVLLSVAARPGDHGGVDGQRLSGGGPGQQFEEDGRSIRRGMTFSMPIRGHVNARASGGSVGRCLIGDQDKGARLATAKLTPVMPTVGPGELGTQQAPAGSGPARPARRAPGLPTCSDSSRAMLSRV